MKPRLWMMFPPVLVLTLVLASVAATAQTQRIEDQQILNAIRRMQQSLFAEQGRPPSVRGSGHPGQAATAATGRRQSREPVHWEGEYKAQPSGETALIVQALLASGISPQDPRLARAIEYMQSIHSQATYASSIRAHVWAMLSNDYQRELMEEARWLSKAHFGGVFNYHIRPDAESRFDHSNTQYGVLGLWEAAKRGQRVSGPFWRLVIDHFITMQNDDGGWGYLPDDDSTESMTTAGLTALLVAQEQLHRQADRPPPRLSAAIGAALAWLQQRADEQGMVGANAMYDLYGVERVALALGLKNLGPRDWYEAGAEHILAEEEGRGAMPTGRVDTAFALLFLARGRVPVWTNKLKLPAYPWNNRPNDVLLFGRLLSDLVEHELNWQVVSVDEQPLEWTNAPIAWLASEADFELTELQLQNLRTYLDAGGMLIASPDMNSHAFSEAVQRLAEQLYPQYELRELPAHHPVFDLVYPIDAQAGPVQGVRALSNGHRELIVLAPSDWGKAMQTSDRLDESPVLSAMANLYALVSDRGRVAGYRWSRPQVLREFPDERPVATAAVARGEYGGNWDPEPAAWQNISNMLHNAARLEVQAEATPLAQLGESKAPLAHLAGVEPAVLTSDELQGLSDYVQAGGTLLVETVGGRGMFSLDMQSQLEDYFGVEAEPITNYVELYDMLQLDQLGDAGALYRRYSVLYHGVEESPRLLVLSVQGRPAIVISHEDLSQGAMGLRYWGTHGYEVEAARHLLARLVQIAAEQRTAP